MWQSASLAFASNHPSASGHFPSNPIIPGALLLDEALAVMLGTAKVTPVTIHAAKFLSAVRPGETVELRWQVLEDAKIKFECHRAGAADLVMTGTLESRSAPP